MTLSRPAIVALLLVIASLVVAQAGRLFGQAPRADAPAAALPAALPAATAALSDEDEKAIRKVVAGIEAAWNAHDMKAYGVLFREDAEWINVVGMHWRGRDAVIAAHVAFHETMFKNHRLTTDGARVRSLGGGHAIAVVTTNNDAFTTPGGNVMPKNQNRLTYVLTKAADGWKIVHGHNVVVDAEAAKHDPVNK